VEEWFYRYLEELEKEFRRIREEMARIEEEFLKPIYDIESGALEPLYETEWVGNEFVVRVDLAGVRSKDDISLYLTEGRLSLHARLERPVSMDDITLFRGRRVTEYRLEIKLPPGAREEDIKARFRNGVLEIRIPVERKSVEIKVE